MDLFESSCECVFGKKCSNLRVQLLAPNNAGLTDDSRFGSGLYSWPQVLPLHCFHPNGRGTSAQGIARKWMKVVYLVYVNARLLKMQYANGTILNLCRVFVFDLYKEP